MNYYIFLTHEGYTYQPNSESDIPDIENLQVIGIAHGENEQEAFYNLINEREYLLSTSFDEIFCYRLASDYKISYAEFSIKYDYNFEESNNENKEFLIGKIKENMDLDTKESHMVFNALFNITENNITKVSNIIINELYCNYYLYVNNYYELSCSLYDDDGLWTDKEYDVTLYEFINEEHDEAKLKKRLMRQGWFIDGGFAICLDDGVVYL